MVFAGVSLSNMLFNIATLSVIVGMTSAVETLSSHDNGAGNYREVGITFHRSNIVIFAMALLFLPVLYYASEIFIMLGIDPGVCVCVCVYCKFCCYYYYYSQLLLLS